MVTSEAVARMRAAGIPGMSIRVAVGGTLALACDLGVSDLSSARPVEPGQLFRVGSLSKPLIAQAILGLIELDQLALDTPIGAHIEELRSHEVGRATVADLLGHTAGLARGPYSTRPESDAQTLARIGRSRLCFPPGTAWKYSNWGYFLLGVLFRRVSGIGLDDHLADRVFRPLGMTRTSLTHVPRGPGGPGIGPGHWDRRRFGHSDPTAPIEPSPHEVLPAYSADLITSSDDYLQWLMSLLGPEHSIDAPRALDALFTARRRLTGTIFSCFGLWLETDRSETRLYSVGMRSGFSAYCFVVPEAALAGVALANCGSRTDELRVILEDCARRATGRLTPRERHLEPMSIVAANRRGQVIRLESNPSGAVELTSDGVSHRLVPVTDRVFRVADGVARPVVRVARSSSNDTIITIGDQRYVEDLDRLHDRPDRPDHRSELAGSYHHPLFGTVDVMVRDGQLLLEFGAMYETALDPLVGLQFIQRGGPFRLETVEFRLERGRASSLTIGDMVFARQAPGECAQGLARSPLLIGSRDD